MIMTGLDKAVEKRIRFFQDKYNCIIFLTEENGYIYMTVSFTRKDGWETVQDIKLVPADAYKEEVMTAMRKYLKDKENY